MTNYLVTRIVSGALFAGIFLWIWPIAYSVQQTVLYYIPVAAPPEDPMVLASLTISSATLIFVAGAFGLIAVYLLATVLEDLAVWCYNDVYKKRRKDVL